MSEDAPTPDEVVLAAALPRAFPFADWGDDRQRREAAWTLLCELRDDGWALLPLPGYPWSATRQLKSAQDYLEESRRALADRYPGAGYEESP